MKSETTPAKQAEQQTKTLLRVLELYPYLSAMRFEGPAELDYSSTDTFYTLLSPFITIRFYYNTGTKSWLSDYIFFGEEYGIEYICEDAGLDALCERLSQIAQDCFSDFNKEMFDYRMDVADLLSEGYEETFADRCSISEYIDTVEENDELKLKVAQLEAEVDSLRQIAATLQHGRGEFH